MSLEANKEVALELFDALRDKDMTRMRNVFADDGEFWVIGEMPLSGTHKKTKLNSWS
jgi:ketosteroid isomerase-like protein